jgi:hypothetical protein
VKKLSKRKHHKLKKLKTLRFRGRVIKIYKTQIGTSKTSYDKKRHALKPGKRISRTGKVYYERRKNRSDKGKWL